jgi:hypothetical protein
MANMEIKESKTKRILRSMIASNKDLILFNLSPELEDQIFYEPDVLTILSKFKEITNGIETIMEICCPISISK